MKSGILFLRLTQFNYQTKMSFIALFRFKFFSWVAGLGGLSLQGTSKKSNLHYAETSNEWWVHLRSLATQLRRNIAAVASRRRHCVRFNQQGIETETFRTDSNVPNN